jgi:rfaE bifunctional protein kinase chain/domain
MTYNSALPDRSRLLELIDGMAGQPVVMIVDLVADRFITGAPKRISREAPVLILRHEREEFIPGGGANAVANVRALGGEPLPLGVVGDDESGRLLLEALTERGITTDGVTVRAGYRTPTKTRILGGGRHAIKQQIVRYDVEDRVQLDASDVDRLTRTLIGWGKRAAVAVLSDYGYGAVPPELSGALRGALADPGIVLADSRYRLDEFRGLDGATPNEEEAEALLGEPLSEEPAALRQSGRLLLDRLASRFLLITRGSQGMSLFLADGGLHLPVHGTDQVADVTGAGDTVIGAFALALAAGATPVEAALLANYAGGMVVMKTGTATLSTDELRDAVSSDHVTLEGSRWEKY